MKPDFIIIGAMKCGTSTLHDQLAAQRGVFMTTPKEPCYFSDDVVYARGPEWYASLFEAAAPGDLRGESSTHYTKLPTYPRTVERVRASLPDVKLVYVMRHPVERLVSQYIHEWSVGRVDGPIDDGVRILPELVDYGRYAMQLEPWINSFGFSAVLPMFAERLRTDPQGELERLARFIGLEEQARWDPALAERNRSDERLRRCAWRDAVVGAPVLRSIRRGLVPKRIRDRVRRFWSMRDRPALSPGLEAELRGTFDVDLAVLGGWLGVRLTCDTFKQAVSPRALSWQGSRGGSIGKLDRAEVMA
jgi:hypothetical protein